MTTVYFTDGELTYANPKTARAKLRKLGYSVRNATKKGEDYHFDVEMPEGAVSQFVPKPITDPTMLTKSRSAILPNKGTKEHTVLQIDNVETTGNKTIANLQVLGKDLIAGDQIMNFVPLVDLTIDSQGVHEIVIPAPNITRQENRYLGFYSVESGSFSSYRIRPEKVYDVRR